MAITDNNGLETMIEPKDIMAFDKESRTIYFCRGAKLYFATPKDKEGKVFTTPRYKRDKAFARFIRTTDDFCNFAKFINSVVNLDGNRMESRSKDCLLWRFSGKPSKSSFSLSSDDTAIFVKKSQCLYFYHSDNSKFILPFITSEFDLGDLMFILCYFFDLSHQFIGDSTSEYTEIIFY